MKRDIQPKLKRSRQPKWKARPAPYGPKNDRLPKRPVLISA